MSAFSPSVHASFSSIVCLLFMPVRRWPWLCTYKGQWPSREGRPCRRRVDEAFQCTLNLLALWLTPRGGLQLFPVWHGTHPELLGYGPFQTGISKPHPSKTAHISQLTKLFYLDFLPLVCPVYPVKLMKTKVPFIYIYGQSWDVFKGLFVKLQGHIDSKVTSFRLKNFKRLRF